MRRIIKLKLCALCTSASLLSLVCLDAYRDLDPCAAMLSVLYLLDPSSVLLSSRRLADQDTKFWSAASSAHEIMVAVPNRAADRHLDS